MKIKSITLPVALRLNTQSFSGLEDFFVIVRVFDKYFKTNVDAESVEDAEQIIEKAIIGFEYQIMNIYKTNE